MFSNARRLIVVHSTEIVFRIKHAKTTDVAGYVAITNLIIQSHCLVLTVAFSMTITNLMVSELLTRLPIYLLVTVLYLKDIFSFIEKLIAIIKNRNSEKWTNNTMTIFTFSCFTTKWKEPKNSQQAHEYLELSNLLSSFTK